MSTKKKYLALVFVMIFVLIGWFGRVESAAAGLPHEAGTLRVAFTSDPPSLGIYDHSSLIATVVNYLTYNGLMKVDLQTLEPVPDLAESYTVANDVEWFFKLKQGVKFHNGTAMTADDVVASLLFSKSVPATALYTSSIEKVEKINDFMVKITTKEPYAGLLYDLAYYYNLILPKELLESGHNFKEQPVGTGSYKFVQWNQGNFLSFESFDEYFDKEHAPKIKKLRINIIPEGSSRTIALEAGEVDLIWEVSGADVANLQENDDIQVDAIDSVDNVILFFNNQRAPFSDVHFRNAVAAAINRDDIIAAALNGYGTLNFSSLAQGHVGYTEKNAVFYDLEQAKKYLDAWGGDPASVKMDILCSNETRVAIGTVIQSNLARIGIKVNVVPMDTAAYMAQWRVADFDTVIASWSPSNALSYVQRFHSDRGKTYGGAIDDPAIDKMVLDMKVTLDGKKRAAMIEEIVATINRLSPQISLYQSQWFRAYNKQLAGVVFSKTGYASFSGMHWEE